MRRPGEAELAAWAGLLKTHAALVPVLDETLRRKAGIPLAWYDVLLELYHAAGRRLGMSELGSRVVLSRSRVSRVVDELAAGGLVRRDPHPTDRRAWFAVLTTAGTTTFRRAAPVYLAGIEERFAAHLSRSEAAAIRSGLSKVLAAVETVGRSAGRESIADRPAAPAGVRLSR